MTNSKTDTTKRRRPKSYWTGVSLHSEASKDVLRSWFAPMADDMTPYKGEILCDVDTDREKKLRAFMIDKGGKHYQFTRTRGGSQYSIAMKRIMENHHAKE